MTIFQTFKFFDNVLSYPKVLKHLVRFDISNLKIRSMSVLLHIIVVFIVINALYVLKNAKPI